jgi:nicotinate-nucleotide pyrophosphorylase (carboxylating)
MLSPFDLDLAAAREQVRRALAEDIGAGDLTSETLVPEDATAEGVFLAREAGVLAGMPVALLAFAELAHGRAGERGGGVALEPCFEEGSRFPARAVLARVRGRARVLLAGERVALNFLQRLSGIATISRAYVEAVAGTGAKIYDTRKTTPGLRALEKYAVRAGGAVNHRMGLYHEALVKDNHFAVLMKVQKAAAPDEVDLREPIAALRRARPGVFVEVEATTPRGVERALAAQPDAILLDNMDPARLRECVALVGARTRPQAGLRRPALEASGGVRLETVRAIAETGVDRVSAGALTHSARALDIALELTF